MPACATLGDYSPKGDIIEGPLPDVRPKNLEPKRITGWMNLFASAYPKSGLTQGAIIYSTKAEADKQPGAARRIGCVYVDVFEGKGNSGEDG